MYRKKGDRENSGEGITALENNVYAIKTLVSSIEGTLGPKGMDCMIVDEEGEFLITNDGVSILSEMDVSHPAAIMMIHAAYSQQLEVGDGTTTMSVIASQILESALYHIENGVPIHKIIEGIKIGIVQGIEFIKSNSIMINPSNIDLLKNVVSIAGRGNQDVIDLVFEASQYIGIEKLKDKNFKFSEIIEAFENGENEVIRGMIIDKKPLNIDLNNPFENVKIMVLDDALEPEALREELMGTENGFNQYIEDRKIFETWIDKLIKMDIGAIFTDRNVDEYATQIMTDKGILVVNRVPNEQIIRLAEYTGARPIKRRILNRDINQLKSYCGVAKKIVYNSKFEHLRIIDEEEKSIPTIIVSAATGAIAMEKKRIAKDAASALQAAVRDGVVTGGGAIEMACAVKLDKIKNNTDTFIKYGVDCVIDGLKKPMYHIVRNGGFNPLEKIEKAMDTIKNTENIHIGINCDTGEIDDLFQLKIVDPVLVKINALKTACEISEAILKIGLILKRKSK